MIKNSIVFLVLLFFGSSVFALGFDMGTAMEQGKLELDLTINPFESISYGQNYVFFHYGLGQGYEFHGYLSKHGYVLNWQGDNLETYYGILKQWLKTDSWDLATSIGIRKVHAGGVNPFLVGPGILYTFKINPSLRLGGHLLYIGEIITNQIRNLHNGWSFELGVYKLITEDVEFAVGAFMNTQAIVRPTYSVNFYLAK